MSKGRPTVTREACSLDLNKNDIRAKIRLAGERIRRQITVQSNTIRGLAGERIGNCTLLEQREVLPEKD